MLSLTLVLFLAAGVFADNRTILGSFELLWSSKHQYPSVKVLHRLSRKVLFQTIDGEPSVRGGWALEYGQTIVDGNHVGRDLLLLKTTAQNIVDVKVDNQSLVFEGFIWGITEKAHYSLHFGLIEDAPNQLALGLEVVPIRGAFNRVFLNYWAHEEESFHGFGVQYSNWNLKGHRVPIVVAEQGVGRGVQPLTAILNQFAKGSGGDYLKSYAPKAVYITNQNRAVLFENSETMFFDLRRPGKVGVELWGFSLRGRILAGDSMLDLVSEITHVTGRMKQLPEWTQVGAVVGLEGGSETVNAKIDILRKKGLPLSAIWLQVSYPVTLTYHYTPTIIDESKPILGLVGPSTCS